MRELRLTSFNTIVGDDFEEMPVKKFLKILKKNLGKNCNLMYTKYNNKFSVVFNGLMCDLILDKNVMDNYALGNYNEFTYELKRILDKIEGKKPSDYEFIGAFIEDEEALQIIKDAKNGVFSNNNAKKIYLEYLKTSKKNIWGLKNIFTTIFYDFKTNYKLFFKKNFASNMPYISTILSLGCIVINPYLSLALHFTLIFGVPFGMALLQKSISKFNVKKIINENIKQLEFQIQEDELKLKNIEKERDEQAEKITDPVLKEIYNLFIRLEKINSLNKSRLREALTKIYKEYIERRNAIQEQDLDESFILVEDNLLKLQHDMFTKTTQIDFEIRKIENNSLENSSFNNQCELLEGIMETSSFDDGADRVIGGDRSSRTKKPGENK